MYFNVSVIVNWSESVPVAIHSSLPNYSVLFEALKHPPEWTVLPISVGNTYQLCFELSPLLLFVDQQVTHFSFNSHCLDSTSKNHVFQLIHKVVACWLHEEAVPVEVPAWLSTDGKGHCLGRVVRALLNTLRARSKDVSTLMAVAGNLILATDNCQFIALITDMSPYIKEVCTVFYSAEQKLDPMYFTREHLVWDCIFMGIAFPSFLGVNCAKFWGSLSELIFSISALDQSYWLEFTSACSIILQIQLYLQLKILPFCKLSSN